MAVLKHALAKKVSKSARVIA